MKPTSLSGADYTAYRRALMGLDGPTMVRTDFHVMTLDHKFISTISPLALDGQVDMDATAETVWALNATFLDPEHILGFDGHGPTDGMGRLNRLIQARCSLYVPGLAGGGGWVSQPVFTGQPISPTRDGHTIALRAYDISRRHLNSPMPYTIRKGTPIVAAIRQILARNGQVFFQFPPDNYVKARLPKNTPVGGGNEDLKPWRAATRLARKHGFDLFPGRQGAAVLRRRPTQGPIITLREVGDGAMLLGSPISSLAEGDIDPINRAHLLSKHTVGKKKAAKRISLRHFENLPRQHAQSAVTLRSGGVNWVNGVWVVEDGITTQKAVNARTKRILANRTTTTVSVQAQCVPFFHGDPNDMVRIESDTYTGNFPLKQYSLPLFDGLLR